MNAPVFLEIVVTELLLGCYHRFSWKEGTKSVKAGTFLCQYHYNRYTETDTCKFHSSGGIMMDCVHNMGKYENSESSESSESSDKVIVLSELSELSEVSEFS